MPDKTSQSDNTLDKQLRDVRDAGALDDNNGAEDWTYSDNAIDQAKAALTQWRDSEVAKVLSKHTQPDNIKHIKLDTNTIQTFCSCGEKFIYISDFEAHINPHTQPVGDIDELERLLRKYVNAAVYYEKTGLGRDKLGEAKAALVAQSNLALLDRLEAKNFAEPCEEDCDAVRHARHTGEWNAYTRMDAALQSERALIEKESRV